MKKIFQIFIGASMLASLLVPAMASAQTQIGSEKPSDSNFQLVSCDGSAAKPCDFNALINTFSRLLKFLLYLAIPLTLGMILYTGWLYLTANGETGQLEKAKKMFIPVLLGLFWIGASYIAVYTVIDRFVSPDSNSNLQQSTKDAIKVLK